MSDWSSNLSRTALPERLTLHNSSKIKVFNSTKVTIFLLEGSNGRDCGSATYNEGLANWSLPRPPTP